MGIYAMSGGATGIGAAIKQQLRDAGHEVIVVDIRDADIEADLSTVEGRERAVAGIAARAPDGLDGFVPCAGLGPHVKPCSLTVKVNYFAAVATIEGVVELVAKKRGSIVVVSSNTAPMAGLDEQMIELMLAGDEAAAATRIDELADGHNAYAGSKSALTRWMRRHAAAYAAQGVRINAIAPGITKTPMTDSAEQDQEFGQAMKDFATSVPLGKIGQPEQIARAACFLLSSDADFMCGSVLFVDGGHDAMLRPDQF